MLLSISSNATRYKDGFCLLSLNNTFSFISLDAWSFCFRILKVVSCFRCFAWVLKKKAGHDIYGLESDILKGWIVRPTIYQFYCLCYVFYCSCTCWKQVFLSKGNMFICILIFFILNVGSLHPIWCFYILHWQSWLCSDVVVTLLCSEYDLFLLNLLAD